MISNTTERARVLELSEEVSVAIEPLWAAGKASLVLRLLLEDCARLLDVARPVSEAESRVLASLEELCQRGTSLGVPLLERELAATHRELLGQLAVWRRRCISQLRGSGARRRRYLWSAAALALLGIASLAFFVFSNTPTASASGVFASDTPASEAIDGLSKTEWLLPDRETGWLELEFARPRAIDSVQIQNGSNRHYLDRGAKTIKLEAIGHGRVLATARGDFPPITSAAPPVTFPLRADGVTKVRITIESFYGVGGGLAEVRVP
jgi:hypothetical protein